MDMDIIHLINSPSVADNGEMLRPYLCSGCTPNILVVLTRLAVTRRIQMVIRRHSFMMREELGRTQLFTHGLDICKLQNDS